MPRSEPWLLRVAQTLNEQETEYYMLGFSPELYLIHINALTRWKKRYI